MKKKKAKGKPIVASGSLMPHSKAYSKKDILHLTLEKKWFNMILSEQKKEEYREIKDFWVKRLLDSKGEPKKYKYVEFKNGYSKISPRFLIEFKGTSIRHGNPEWGSPLYPTFVISLGNIVEKCNC